MGSTTEPGGTRPAATSCGDTVSSTIWKVSLAVLPMMFFSFSGSLSPGAWTTMRSTPWRWIAGSLVPSASIRRRMISIDCSTALPASAFIAWSEKVMRRRCSGAVAMVTSRPPPFGNGAPTRLRSRFIAVLTLAGSVIRTETAPST